MSARTDLPLVVCSGVSLGDALKRLKRQCEGILREVKHRAAFEPPSARRRRKALRARKRLARRLEPDGED